MANIGLLQMQRDLASGKRNLERTASDSLNTRAGIGAMTGLLSRALMKNLSDVGGEFGSTMEGLSPFVEGLGTYAGRRLGSMGSLPVSSGNRFFKTAEEDIEKYLGQRDLFSGIKTGLLGFARPKPKQPKINTSSTSLDNYKMMTGQEQLSLDDYMDKTGQIGQTYEVGSSANYPPLGATNMPPFQ